MPKLTDKQELFVKHYIATLNATEAARLAGYGGDYSTLKSIGYENLTKPYLRKAIDNHLKAKTMGADEVLARLDAHARIDMGDFLGEDSFSSNTVNLKQAKEKGLSHLIKKVKQRVVTTDETQYETFEFELHDAQAALVHLGKAYGLFKQEIEHSGLISWEQVVSEARKDVDKSDPYA